MNIILYLYSIVLLGYTGWRTYDFMSLQLPAEGSVRYVLPLLFLFATEIGLLMWHYVLGHEISTKEQHNIVMGLVVVDFFGSLSAGIADMILRQTFVSDYQIPELLVMVLIYGMPAIVAINVFGFLAYDYFDAEKDKKRTEQEVIHEIHRQAMDELRSNKGLIAKNLRKAIKDELADRIVNQVGNEYKSVPNAMLAMQEPAPKTVHGSEVRTFQQEIDTNPTTRQQ